MLIMIMNVILCSKLI